MAQQLSLFPDNLYGVTHMNGDPEKDPGEVQQPEPQPEPKKDPPEPAKEDKPEPSTDQPSKDGDAA
jgi:hypothetical protein